MTYATKELQIQLFALTGIAALAGTRAINLEPEYIAKLALLLSAQTSDENQDLLASPEDIIDFYFDEYFNNKQKDEDRTVEAS